MIEFLNINYILSNWILFLIPTVLTALYYYFTSTFDHFKKKGVKYIKPVIFVGNLAPRILRTKSFIEVQWDIYKKFKGCRYAGVFEGSRPVLHILDPDLIKAVTIRDFDYFADREVMTSNDHKYITRSLLWLEGPIWKEIRSKLTPTFSSARLRNMLPLIELCSKQLTDFMYQFDGKEVEMKDTMGHFTLEVIGLVAFGMKSDALTDENSKFVMLVEKLFVMSTANRYLLFFALMFFPRAIKFFNIAFFDKDAAVELMQMLKKTKAQRRIGGEKKNDFLQLLIDAAEKEESEVKNGQKLHLDNETADAQSFLFLIAGYETSSTLLSFAMHVLATNPEVQTKLRNHIVAKTEGKEINYELLSELTYLDAVIQETLRMYPPAPRLERVCTKRYLVPNSDVVIEKGENIAIPLIGIHMDPDIYKDPYEFKPERFIGNAKREIPAHLFLSFGSGPRNCLGGRFAMYSAKMALVSLIKNFEFSPCSKTIDPIKFDKVSILLKGESGIWVKVKKL